MDAVASVDQCDGVFACTCVKLQDVCAHGDDGLDMIVDAVTKPLEVGVALCKRIVEIGFAVKGIRYRLELVRHNEDYIFRS